MEDLEKQQAAELEERAALLARELGSTVLQELLVEYGLEDGLSTLEAGAIAGCLSHMEPVGHVSHRLHMSADEKMRTRIIHTPFRDDATERDWKLYNFKLRLRNISREQHLFGRK